MNVERTPQHKRQQNAKLRASVDPRQGGAWADGKISVPRVRAPGARGAPLGVASNFNKKAGADAPGSPADGEEAEPPSELRADADRVASVLAHALRKLMGRSQEKCRLWVVAPSVTFVEYVSGKGKSRVGCEGLSTCKSCNCPLCVRKWERVRTAEIQSAVANWLRKELPVIFASLTMRHHPKMPLALETRILGAAFGNLWSGNKGKKFAKAVGGKPESVRAHDLTWSEEAWWHPHLHALMLHAAELNISMDELEALFRQRWQEALPSTLRSMKKMVKRLLGDESRVLGAGPCSVHKKFMRHIAKRGARCWRGHALHRRIAGRKHAAPEAWDSIEEHHQCSDCAFELGLRAKPRKGEPEVLVQPGDRLLHDEWLGETCSACMFGTGECPNNRERAARVFGKSLVPDHLSVRESMLKLRKMLRAFTEKNILPTFERGVVLDRVHKGDAYDQVASYLPKLGAIGFELASSSTKLGWEDEHGRRHYSKWEVAQLCALRGEGKTRAAARRAWRQMYRATKGLAQISFSDREAMGLGDDPYANGNEPPEIDVDENETRRVLGHVEKPIWVGMARERGHALIGAIVTAHRTGVLQRLSWVSPPMGGDKPTPVLDPEDRAPPEVSAGLDAAQAAAARARWRAERDRTRYEAEKVDRARRWELLREVAHAKGPPAWAELVTALVAADCWLGSGAVRGAEYWRQANAAHERREHGRRGEICDRVTRALEALGAVGALKYDPSLTKREQLLRIEVARTLRRSGLDRVTSERLARELVN